MGAEITTDANLNVEEGQEKQEQEKVQGNPSEADKAAASPKEEKDLTDMGENKPNIEARLSEALAEIARLKRKADQASSEAAKYKRDFMANKTEAEQKAIEKAEEDARIKEELAELRKETALNRLEKSFVALGYSEDMAKQAAEAQYENNTDLLFQIQKKFFSEQMRSMKAQLMKEMPAPASGNTDSVNVTKEDFAAMDYKQRVELFNKYPQTYKKLTE